MHVLPALTTEMYDAVLEAWSWSCRHKLSRAVNAAQRLLDEMDIHDGSIYRSNPCAPNSWSYELVIETYARIGYNYPWRTIFGKLMRKMKLQRDSY